MSALTDTRASEERTPPPDIAARLTEIERALKFDPDHEYRRQLVREYLNYFYPVEIDDVF